jgi:hypothetical protein
MQLYNKFVTIAGIMIAEFCQFRVTRDTIQFGNPVIIKKEDIPINEGVCSVSETRTEPCHSFPYTCNVLENLDFCKKSWAKGRS